MFDAPMDCAASITPWSISRSDCSTIRATNGAAETTSATIAAFVPIVVPTIMRVNGWIVIIRIRNGTERRMLTMPPTIQLRLAIGWMPFLSLITRNTPSGIPIR